MASRSAGFSAAIILCISLVDISVCAPAIFVDTGNVHVHIELSTSSPVPSKSSLERRPTTAKPTNASSNASSSQLPELITPPSGSENVSVNSTESAVPTEISTTFSGSNQSSAVTGGIETSTQLLNATEFSTGIGENGTSISTEGSITTSAALNNESTSASETSTESTLSGAELNATSVSPIENGTSSFSTGLVEESTPTAILNVSAESTTSIGENATGLSSEPSTAVSELSTIMGNESTSEAASTEFGNVTAESTPIAESSTMAENVTLETTASTELVNGSSSEAVNGSSTESLATVAGVSTELANGTTIEAINGSSTELATTVAGASTELVNGSSTEAVNGSSTELVNGSSTEAVNGSSTETLTTIAGASTESINGTSTGELNGTSTIELINGTSTESLSTASAISNETSSATESLSTELFNATTELVTPANETGLPSNTTAVSTEFASTVENNGTSEASTMGTELLNTTVALSNESSTGAGNVTEASSLSSLEANATTTVFETTSQVSNANETASPTEQPIHNVTSGQQVNTSVFDCANHEPGLYGNPHLGCDRKFYICTDSTVLAYEQPCPARLYFDPELKVCESWIHIPVCSGNTRPPFMSTEAPINGTASTAAPVVQCLNKTDGNYPDPIGTVKPGCSNRFYICIGGISIQFHCPIDLIYDAEINECARQDDVFACTGKHVNETKSTTLQPVTLPHIDFDCSGRRDGYYVVNCSNTFYSCNGGQGRKLNCPHGLVFDEEFKKCDIPSNIFMCTGTNRTTKVPTTTESANITITTPSPMHCDNVPDGIYRDPQLACSHFFYFCAHNVSFHGVCPANLFYDAGRKRCDLWINVFDCSGIHPTSLPKTTPSPPPVFPAVDFDCLRREDGNYVNPKDKCSKFYYICANMEGFLQECAADLYYDPDRDLCDSWMHVFACSGKTVPPSTKATTPIVRTTKKPAFDCVGKLDGTYQNPVNACSHIYYQCVSGITYSFECPAGLYFDRELDQCDTFDNVFNCSGLTRAPSTSSSRPTPTTPNEQEVLDCMFLADGDYSDPRKNCSNTYYSCAGGYAFVRLCPHGTIFDSDRDQCDTFSNVPQCSGKPRTTTPAGQSTKRTPRPVFPFDCTKRYDGNYQAGDCSQQFWSCVGGLTFPRHCLFGLVYDAENDDCEFPFSVPKCGGKRITPTAKQLSTTRSPLLFNCAFMNDGNYPDPQAKDNCSNVFYTCANGITSRLRCPSGLFYDPNMDSCDYRANVAVCTGKSVITSAPTTTLFSNETSTIEMTSSVSGSTSMSNETTIQMESSSGSPSNESTTASLGTAPTTISENATTEAGMSTEPVTGVSEQNFTTTSNVSTIEIASTELGNATTEIFSNATTESSTLAENITSSTEMVNGTSTELINGTSTEAINGSSTEISTVAVSTELVNGSSTEAINGSSTEMFTTTAGASTELVNGTSTEALNGSSTEAVNGSSTEMSTTIAGASTKLINGTSTGEVNGTSTTELINGTTTESLSTVSSISNESSLATATGESLSTELINSTTEMPANETGLPSNTTAFSTEFASTIESNGTSEASSSIGSEVLNTTSSLAISESSTLVENATSGITSEATNGTSPALNETTVETGSSSAGTSPLNESTTELITGSTSLNSTTELSSNATEASASTSTILNPSTETFGTGSPPQPTTAPA